MIKYVLKHRVLLKLCSYPRGANWCGDENVQGGHFRQRLPPMKGSFLCAALQIVITAVRFIARLLVGASARVIISDPRYPMLLGVHVHSYLHLVIENRCGVNPLSFRYWKMIVLYFLLCAKPILTTMRGKT